MYLNAQDIYLMGIFISLEIRVLPLITQQIGLPKVKALFIFTFLFCLLGWEAWWSMGLIPGSTPYDIRYQDLYSTKTPTSPNSLHALVQSFGDAVIICYLFGYGFKIYPSAKTIMNRDFMFFILIVGVAQNIIVTAFSILSPFDPQKDVLSWSPVAGNATCPEQSIICFNNQRMWIITPLVCYLYFLRSPLSFILFKKL